MILIIAGISEFLANKKEDHTSSILVIMGIIWLLVKAIVTYCIHLILLSGKDYLDSRVDPGILRAETAGILGIVLFIISSVYSI